MSRGWRTSRIFLTLLWIIMLSGSVYLVSVFVTALLRPSVRQLASLDWSGYVVVSDFTNPSSVVTGVNGSWTVPTVTVSTVKDMFSAAWVGIGGQVDNTLIQVGTEHDSVSGQAAYSAWYELLPNDSITITTITVSPGDKISASITLLDSATNEWSIEINDVTNSQRFQGNFQYNSPRLSAEYVMERPTVNNGLGALADFGSITFTDSKAAMNQTVGTISGFPFAQVVMQDRQNRQLVNVSSLSANGTTFTVTYLSGVTAAQTQVNKAVENRIAQAPRTVVLAFSIEVLVSSSKRLFLSEPKSVAASTRCKLVV